MKSKCTLLIFMYLVVVLVVVVIINDASGFQCFVNSFFLPLKELNFDYAHWEMDIPRDSEL